MIGWVQHQKHSADTLKQRQSGCIITKSYSDTFHIIFTDPPVVQQGVHHGVTAADDDLISGRDKRSLLMQFSIKGKGIVRVVGVHEFMKLHSVLR